MGFLDCNVAFPKAYKRYAHLSRETVICLSLHLHLIKRNALNGILSLLLLAFDMILLILEYQA